MQDTGMIDWDALVLTPLIQTLSLEVTVYPEISRPGDLPYRNRGVFSSQPLTVEMQDGTVFSDQQTTLGVRIGDFKHLPTRGDRIKINEGPATGHQYWVGDTSTDGQGGATITLRLTEPT